MEILSWPAPAKINWGLDIVGRRADGYHELLSLMQTLELADEIVLERALEDDCLCPGLHSRDNLALRAWLLLKQEYGLTDCLRIRINKRIPVSAGLAGGSSDAAAVLLAANSLLGLKLGKPELCALGLRLGADIPFCLHGGLAVVSGIGERVIPLGPAPALNLLLINPGFPLSTAAVYAACDRLPHTARPNIPALQAALLIGDIPAIYAHSGNALESAAFSLRPELAELKQAIVASGLRPLMSGSGPTFFVVTESRAAAEAARRSLTRLAPWLHVTATTADPQ